MWYNPISYLYNYICNLWSSNDSKCNKSCDIMSYKFYTVIDLKKLYNDEHNVDNHKIITMMFDSNPLYTNFYYNARERLVTEIRKFGSSESRLKHLITLENLTRSCRVVLTKFQTECLEKLTHNDNIKIDYGWYSC